jgi:hypothetical protein
MPIINRPLSTQGHALVEVLLFPATPRRKALAAVGVALPPPKAVLGLIDPGATVTVIDMQLTRTLHLVPSGFTHVTTPHTAAPVPVPAYKVDLYLLSPGGVVPITQSLSVVAMPLVHTGSDVLVGCDALSHCQFIHNGSNGTFSLAL